MENPGNGVSGAAAWDSNGWAAQVFDVSGLERIYTTYRGLVAEAVAWKLSGFPKEEIDEVASAVWAKLLADRCARLRGYCGRNGAAFPTWLAKVAKNAATDYLRKRRLSCVPLDAGRDDHDGGRRPPYSPGDFLKDRSPDPLERLVAREARKEMLLAVRGLPKIYRQIVIARFYKGWDCARTAAVFGIDEDTVYVRLARAFAKLRKELGRRGMVLEDSRREGVPDAAAAHRHLSGRERIALLERDSRTARRLQLRPGRDSLCYECWRLLLWDAILWQRLVGLRRPAERRPRVS